MKIEIKHLLNSDYKNGIEATQKTWRLFGVVVWQKTHYYPKLENYEVFLKF
jgi:hypothetical protein